MNNNLLNIFIFIPFLAFIITAFIPKKKELIISRIAFFSVGLNLLSFIIFFIFWLIHGHRSINLPEIDIFKEQEYEFVLDLFFDRITAMYMMVGALLTFLITIYSRYYLHREEGYKRFFIIILFFYFGYNLTILSGNFETLFIGWEVLGISSFLLIAFYRDRYLPVRNAVKVFSIYRLGDLGILLAMWASHHLWHENITFFKLYNAQLVHAHLDNHTWIGVFISLCILLACAAKSAQWPFTSWLPRAMEGPTPSSAIFYGSLSVHFGVFLLLRTHPFWEEQTSVRIIVVILGFFSAIISYLIMRVQSNIKAKIAYSSASQIGIIFIEIALGFDTFALFHFAGNAFLRTYQLLVSPSVVSYLIKEQFYFFKPRNNKSIMINNKLHNSIYILSLKEWNLDLLMNKIIFGPFKWVGHRLDFLTTKNVLFYLVPAYIVGVILLIYKNYFPIEMVNYFPGIFSFIALILVLKSFVEHKYPLMALMLIVFNFMWIALAVSFNDAFNATDMTLYLSGVVFFAPIAYWSLWKLKKLEPNYFSAFDYMGHVYEHPILGTVAFIGFLGLMGFPISPTFIGEDLVFGHIHQNQFFPALFTSTAYIVAGISLVRLYARLFFGSHVKNYHAVPGKLS